MFIVEGNCVNGDSKINVSRAKIISQFTETGEQKFGRADASSPVPTSLNQAVTVPQAHLQQQAFINATTMPPYYGGLAFYPGAGMMAGGFPAYTTPMYQVLHAN